MLDQIAHRGPDGRGVAEDHGATLGHVRLAIQDPTPASAQPFRRGDVTLTYVGELWNAVELRRDLKAQGEQFVTTGDTEVVAAVLDRWGPDGVEELDGMFALAWTDPDGTWLARDRFGKVPLYWVREERLLGEWAAWCSERKGLGPYSVDAAAVPPGVTLGASGQPMRDWYGGPGQTGGWPETCPESVRAMLTCGVQRRLVSDVPVCCLISGGLDSALILRLVREQMPDVVAYHAYRDSASPDLTAARQLAAEWDVTLIEVPVRDPDLADVEEAVRAVEVPMKAQIEIALLCLPLAHQIREDGFRVVLSGESADEVFGGYGNLARKSGSDEEWRAARIASVQKMARGNFCRVNKVFMAHGVEGRLPFMERNLVERVLALGVKDCPPGKGLLKEAARGLVPDWVIKREKETFQGAGGMISACASLFPSPIKAYNEIARKQFGHVPHE